MSLLKVNSFLHSCIFSKPAVYSTLTVSFHYKQALYEGEEAEKRAEKKRSTSQVIVRTGFIPRFEQK